MKASSPHNKGPILPLVDGAGAMVYEQAKALYISTWTIQNDKEQIKTKIIKHHYTLQEQTQK